MSDTLVRSWKDPHSDDHDTDNPVATIAVGAAGQTAAVQGTQDLATIGCCTSNGNCSWWW